MELIWYCIRKSPKDSGRMGVTSMPGFKSGRETIYVGASGSCANHSPMQIIPLLDLDPRGSKIPRELKSVGDLLI